MTTPAHPGMQSRFGDNQPPPSADPLRERLEETYREQLALVDHLVAEAGRVPPINDDRIAGAVGDYVKECVAHEKALNAIRVGEKEPYLHGGRTVDAVFTAASERLRGAGGAVSTLRSYWTHCDLDRGKIDLEALRPHFTEQAIVSALGAYIKAGGRSIVGATIFEATAATVR